MAKMRTINKLKTRVEANFGGMTISPWRSFLRVSNTCPIVHTIAQGLLQYLALYFRRDVWTHFRSWLLTMNPAQPPSEAVVAQALRSTLPEFLVDTSD